MHNIKKFYDNPQWTKYEKADFLLKHLNDFTSSNVTTYLKSLEKKNLLLYDNIYSKARNQA